MNAVSNRISTSNFIFQKTFIPISALFFFTSASGLLAMKFQQKATLSEGVDDVVGMKIRHLNGNLKRVLAAA